MTDIHSHLIPNLDDGSTSLKRSLEIFSQMSQRGIKELYLTSHYFRGHYHYLREEYDQKFEDLRLATEKEGIELKLYPGFEIFVQPGIVEDIKEKNLCLGDSKYVLIESELNGLPDDFYANVYPILRAGYKPILAHAERYVSIMKNPELAYDLIGRDIYIQSNAGSFLGFYGEKVKQTVWELLENGWIHFIASDEHGKGNFQTLFDAKELIKEKIDEHTTELLFNKFPKAIASGEPIPYIYLQIEETRRKRRRSLWEKLFG